MNVMKFEKYGTHMAVIKTDKILVHDEHDFLDFMAQAMHEAQAQLIIVEKAAFPEKFFDLKSGLAGYINQKLVTYRGRMAIVGDFSKYKSNALKAYIRESNETGNLVFKDSVKEAISYFAD